MILLFTWNILRIYFDELLQLKGVAVCICQRKCPVRKHPVCGSDGVAYENHCELHREACIQGNYVYISETHLSWYTLEWYNR